MVNSITPKPAPKCPPVFETKEIKISAQAYLEKFYTDLGFERKGGGYMEDGIPHCAMYYNI